jgi:hypothetical protein
MTDKNDKKEGKLRYLFPDYRIWEDIPFGFWFVGFFAVTLAFFNLSINFFSHFALLLGWMTGTVKESYRVPGGLDLFLSGFFALYYLVSAPLFFYFGTAYWNFRSGIKKRLKWLLIVDAVIFVTYNIISLNEIYLYENQYLKLKAPIYIALFVVALYFISTRVDDDAKLLVRKAGENK